MSELKFPANPTHGLIFQLKPGYLFQYDATINSWIKLESDTIILPLATNSKAGAMSSIDLKKLNRLVLPPPTSTIIGNDCVASFKSGNIELVGGDEFVSVDGNVNVGNIDQFGNKIGKEIPFHIHEYTYGYDFNLNIPALVEELKARGQLKTFGATGDAGLKGQKGDKGEDQVLSGPQGSKGIQGSAPNCTLTVEPEPLLAQARPGLKKALTGVRVTVDPNDESKYYLEFDRQDIGITSHAASSFNVRQQNSTWILAVASVAPDAQAVFYIDIEPIISTAHEKFLSELELLKKGYEDITQFWVQTMSDLFDEQKDALCCALEHCMSKTKSTQLRQHMESVAAAAIPNAKIVINPRDSGEAVEISNMGLNASLPDGEDLCGDGGGFPPPPPPPPPLPPGGDDEYDDDDLEPQDCSGGIDILFSIDDTGSMGSALTSVKSSVNAIVEKVKEASGGSYRLALVAFKDADEVRTLVPFSDGNEILFKSRISGLIAAGGGDGPEAGAASIIQGSRLDWESSNAKLAVHITDQITHPTGPTMETAALAAAAKKISFAAIYAVTGGDDPTTENQLRQLARITKGVYAKLSDSAVDDAVLRFIDDACAFDVEFKSPVIAAPYTTGSKDEAGGSDLAWVGVENSKSCGDSKTTTILAGAVGNFKSKILYASKFYFDRTIPSDAVITKITAKITRTVIGEGEIKDRAVSFFKNQSDFTGPGTPSIGDGYEKSEAWPKTGFSDSASIASYEMTVGDLPHFTTSVVRSEGFGIGLSVDVNALKPSLMGYIECISMIVDWTNGLSPMSAVMKSSAITEFDVVRSVIIDPLIHTGVTRAVAVDLPSGDYSAIITKMDTQIDGNHYVPLVIQYNSGGKLKTAKFLDKGHFKTVIDAKSAYEGLTTAFRHDGGRINLYYNIFPTSNASGNTTISFSNTNIIVSEPVINDKKKQVIDKVVPPKELSCRMPSNKLHWYEKGWLSGKCCGVVMNISGQDYIIMKRSIGDDDSCGGGEDANSPCISKFNETIGHPAIAWPTLDGKSFAPIPSDGSLFRYNKILNNIVSEQLANENYINPKGNPNGVRHLTYQLMSVIFPVT